MGKLCIAILKDMEAAAAEQGEEVKINPSNVIKPLHKLVGDHKDVVKIVIQLNTIVSTIKPEIADVLEQFSVFSELWTQVNKLQTHYTDNVDICLVLEFLFLFSIS